MAQKRIYLSPPHMNGLEPEYVKNVFETNWIAPLGPHVDGFENEIAEKIGVKSAVALSSGTAGIHLALKYLGVAEGDYVLCSSLTFSGSCNPILYEKAIPVFIDSEPESWNMSPVALEKAFVWSEKNGIKPKAVIVVNLYGLSADWDRILPLCEKYGIPIIEDAAESLGSFYMDKPTGSFGDLGIFSFNGNKVITTSGGGMVVSNDEDAIKKMRFWATQSREPARHYEHKEIGYNYRMSGVCAAIGRGQLNTLEDRVRVKREIYYRYKEEFANLPITMMPVTVKCKPNYWLSAFTINQDCSVEPDDIIKSLEKENIESRPLWKPMNSQPIFEGCSYFKHNDNISIGDDLFTRGVCLPSGTAMSEEELDRVIEVVKRNF